MPKFSGTYIICKRLPIEFARGLETLCALIVYIPFLINIGKSFGVNNINNTTLSIILGMIISQATIIYEENICLDT